MKTACIYTRVSGLSQEQEGTSLMTQKAACLLKAEELGYEVPEGFIVSETYSGLTLDREVLSQVREWIRNGEVEALICHSLDRLIRDPVHGVILQDEREKAGVDLILVTETIDDTETGKMIGYIKSYAAKLEAARIRERTMRGRKARIASGKLMNGKANNLFGYDYRLVTKQHLEGEGERHINTEQARIVGDIFAWFIGEHLPLDGVVYRLRDLGISSPTGNSVWPRATVYKMLTNSAYCGAIATPALIAQDTFDKAQVKLKRNRELASRNVKRNYLLRGYAYCRYCGRRYQGALKRYQTKQGVKEYEYYRCSSSFKINANPCPNHTWKAQDLEARVWERVEPALRNPDVIMAGIEALKQEANRADSHLDALATIDARLKDLDKQQRKLLDSALRDFPQSMLDDENRIINTDRENLQQRRAEVKTRIEQARQAEVSIESIEQALALIQANLGSLSFEGKRLALEAFSIRVNISKDRIDIEGLLPVSRGVLSSVGQIEMGSECRLSPLAS